jgi:photosystem II stability/assembly factor-like uncharacterized protein
LNLLFLIFATGYFRGNEMRLHKFLVIFILLISSTNIKAQLWIEEPTNITDPLLQIVFADSIHGWGLPSYYKVQSNFYLIRTTDGGQAWQKINYTPQNEEFREIQFIDSLAGYARGYSKIYKTLDGGQSWSVVLDKYDQGQPNGLSSSSMSFVNKNFGVAAYYEEIFKTEDGGSTWKSIYKDPYWAIRKVFFPDSSIGWLQRGPMETLYKTTNSGTTWDSIANNMTPSYFADALFGYVISGGIPIISVTTNGGNSWNQIFNINSSSAQFAFKKMTGYVYDNTNNNSAYRLFRTIDAGTTWTTIPISSISGSVVQSIAFTDTNHIWLGGFGGEIYKYNGNPVINVVTPNGGETFFEGQKYQVNWEYYNLDSGKCKIELSTNNGNTWELIADSFPTSLQSKIRISLDQYNSSDMSDNYFRIYKTGHLYLLYPLGDVGMTANIGINVRWSADYSTNSKIVISLYVTPDTINTLPQKLYSWSDSLISAGIEDIFFPDSTTFCKIIISDEQESWITAESYFFRIRQKPSIVIKKPANNFILPVDSTRQILVYSTNVQDLKVELSTDNASSWNEIFAVVKSDTIGSSYTSIDWKVPNIVSNNCLVRVSTPRDSTVTPVISGMFQITNRYPLGFFPLAEGNTWYYKHIFQRFPSITGYGGYYFAPPNIYFIIRTNPQVLKEDGKEYFPFVINVWDSLSGDYSKFVVDTTLYFRNYGNQIYQFGNSEPWLNFEIVPDTQTILGIIRNTYYVELNDYVGTNLVADSLGIAQLFSFEGHGPSAPSQLNYLVGALINGKVIGDTLNVTGIKEITNTTPKTFDLMQNYPNPFNPTTTIRFSIPYSSNVTLKVYDILGREIKTLVNEEKSSGMYEVSFNASNLSSGVYFYRINASSKNESQHFTDTKKLILLK